MSNHRRREMTATPRGTEFGLSARSNSSSSTRMRVDDGPLLPPVRRLLEVIALRNVGSLARVQVERHDVPTLVAVGIVG